MKISEVKKSFGHFSLHLEKMEFRQGEVYGIIGPNGCGKTTAMKLLAGLLKPDSGHIDYQNLGQRDITMVFRKPYLLHDTVLRNLTYPLKIRGLKPEEAQLKRVLEPAGLWACREGYAPGLSSGEQQKLALLRAMIFSPKLLLIDEAFSNLDMESASLFEELILARQREEPVITILCAHQLSHIRRLCDYTFFLQGGRVLAEGPTEELLGQPENPLLQKYLQYVGR